MVLDRIRRMTRDGRWIPEIDGLRFLAILSVLLFHIAGELMERSGREILPEPRYAYLFRLIGNGDRGVRLFFVISGMILALPFVREALKGGKPVSLRNYYLRRLTRLEPPYLASLLLILLLTVLYLHGLPPAFGSHALASLLYQHTLVFGSMSTLNPVTWSLEVEIQFYLLAPFAMRLFYIQRRAMRRGVLLIGIVAVGLAQIPLQASPRATGSILFYLQYFLTGLLLADIFTLDLESMRPSLLWDLAGLVSLGCIFWPVPSMAVHILLPLPIAVLILAVFRSRVLRRIFAIPSLAVIGGMCYSIYLLHFIFMAAIFKLSRHLIQPGVDFLGNYLVQVVALGGPVLVLCTAFYLAVERPCMDPNWPARLWLRLSGKRTDELDQLDSSQITETQKRPPSRA